MTSFWEFRQPVWPLAATVSGSKTTSVFSCLWHTNVDVVTSQLHLSWNPFGFHRESCSNFFFFKVLFPAFTNTEAGRSWRSWQHYCTVIGQPHPFFFSNIRHPVGTKTGTDMKVWQITQCSKSVCLEKQKWLWAYYCKCPAFYSSFIFFYFFPSPALNVFCVCCVILIVNKHTSWETSYNFPAYNIQQH